MVQTYPIISSPWNPNRISNRFESPATAGLFTKVPQRPTNHSKFTGKCGRPRCASCHIHPAGKAKNKTKGTQKLKSCDVVTNYRLVTWRVVDSRPGLNFSGFSATGILDHLDNNNDYFSDDDDQIDDVCGLPPHPSPIHLYPADWIFDAAIDDPSTSAAIEEVDDFDGEDDDKMSFCEVGFAWEQVEEGDDEDDDNQSWCLVEEI